jgi:hypothetical protein
MKNTGIALFFISFLFVGCGPSTKLVRSWVNEENTPGKYEKLAVVTLTPNSSSRYLMERAMVADLKDDGIKAIPTYEIFPFAGKINELGDLADDAEELKRKVVQKVTDNKIDALMIISVFNVEKEQRYVSDNNYAMGGVGYYGSPYMAGRGYYGTPYMRGAYYNYYAYSISTIYNSGYYVDDYTYFLECNLYDVASEKLLWTGRTKTVNMKSVEEEVITFSKVVIREIINKKVIVP